MTFSPRYTFLFVAVCFFAACKGGARGDGSVKVLKGLYVFGAEMNSFTDCNGSREYWVNDQSNTLKDKYSKIITKEYEPVYVEFEAAVVASDTTVASEFDSTLLVKKILAVSKKIPDGPCAQ